MAITLGHINAGSKHQGTEWNTRNPSDEADECEDGKDQKDDSSAVVFARQHVDGGDESKDDVQDTCGPDKGLGEQPGQPDVSVTQEECASQTEDEEDESVGVETKIV